MVFCYPGTYVLTDGRCTWQITYHVVFSRICTKYIDAAMERLKTKENVDDQDLSLVERILAGESDPKTAYILALDFILVGIDTVSCEAPGEHDNEPSGYIKGGQCL